MNAALILLCEGEEMVHLVPKNRCLVKVLIKPLNSIFIAVLAAGGPGVKNENDNKMKMNTYVNIYSNMGILALR